MSTISIANFLIEEKRIAKIIDLLQTALGDGDDTNTPSKGAANALTAVAALGDNDQLTALLPAAINFADAMKFDDYYYAACYKYLKAFDEHVGGINDFLEDNTSRVHYLTRAAYPRIQVKNTFPPVTDFGSMAVTGSGAGTWTAQDSVDTDEYGDGLIEFVTESLIGAASIVVTIIGTDFNGDAVTASGTITNGTTTATTVAIAGSTRFATITSVTFTGGTNADAFRIQTKFDRAPTGCA